MANAASVHWRGSRGLLLTCCEQVSVECRIPATQQGKGTILDLPPCRRLPLSSQRVATRNPVTPMPLGDGVWIAMIRDGLSRLLEARSLFAHVEMLVTNLVSDTEGDQRLLGDHQVCQECSQKFVLFAQFLLIFITYESLSYSVHLRCANFHTSLPFHFHLYDFQNIKTRHPNLFGAVLGKGHL